VPKATIAAILILVLSAGISFGFVVQRGGIDLPVIAAAPGSTAIALAPSPSIEPTDLPSVEPATDPAVVEASSAARAHRPWRRHRRSPRRPVAQPVALAERAAVVIAAPTTAPVVTPTPEATPQPTPKPTRSRRATGTSSSTRAQPAELLDLHGAVGRQPVQHRPLLRDPDERDLRLEPALRERRPPPPATSPDATAQALTGSARRATPPIAGPAAPLGAHDALFSGALTRPKTRDRGPPAIGRGVAGSPRCVALPLERGAGRKTRCGGRRSAIGARAVPRRRGRGTSDRVADARPA
jgi:hypothetical protein